jgi:protein-L-isoaspartate(D-aspartate) O-methyltransferase
MSSLSPHEDEDWGTQRAAMVREQLRGQDISDERVLAAMASVPRHLFVPRHLRARAYDDMPLPIGHGQTISQPLMVATMLQAMRLRGCERVLEVGAGSAYQAALLGELAREVVAVEIVPELARSAADTLRRLGHSNVEIVEGDGSLGWPAKAPYDVIAIAAAAPAVPPPLIEQLAIGGRLLAPVGGRYGQTLVRMRKLGDGRVVTEDLGGCAFVPLVGEHGRQS